MVKGSDFLLIIVAIFCPPVAALFISGCCSCDLLINILLCLIGLLPGHIVGVYPSIGNQLTYDIACFLVIYRKMKAEERYGRGGYIYIGQGVYEPVITERAQPAQPPPYGAV
ncbi:hypothetical protein CPB85DRAFT_1436059 [Mucidula mucida]|nr:hypothetical protein CPB85DRAFT_1436059 [Mucidula mucida]